jgi:hypothetical protein
MEGDSSTHLASAQEYPPEGCGDSLAYAFLRPAHSTYPDAQLKALLHPHLKSRKHDCHMLKFLNFAVPVDVLLPAQRDHALIYCHSEGGNKTEAADLLAVLPESFCVVLFDFAGCGRAQEI